MMAPHLPRGENSSISENVVVCIPVLWASDMSAVRNCAPGMSWLIRVDFPTPLLPLRSVILSTSSGRSSSMPSPFSADIATHL